MWDSLKMHRTVCQVFIEQFDANQQSCVKWQARGWRYMDTLAEVKRNSQRWNILSILFRILSSVQTDPSQVSFLVKTKKKKLKHDTDDVSWTLNSTNPFPSNIHWARFDRNATTVSTFSCTSFASHRATGYSPVCWLACQPSYFPWTCWSSSRFMTPDTQSNS